jgi:hypothetical protein
VPEEAADESMIRLLEANHVLISLLGPDLHANGFGLILREGNRPSLFWITGLRCLCGRPFQRRRF